MLTIMMMMAKAIWRQRPLKATPSFCTPGVARFALTSIVPSDYFDCNYFAHLASIVSAGVLIMTKPKAVK